MGNVTWHCVFLNFFIAPDIRKYNFHGNSVDSWVQTFNCNTSPNSTCCHFTCYTVILPSIFSFLLLFSVFKNSGLDLLKWFHDCLSWHNQYHEKHRYSGKTVAVKSGRYGFRSSWLCHLMTLILNNQQDSVFLTVVIRILSGVVEANVKSGDCNSSLCLFIFPDTLVPFTIFSLLL